jgi:Na+-translocating ferredoxin:NAD+ oxidoreductase RnfG subunit
LVKHLLRFLTALTLIAALILGHMHKEKEKKSLLLNKVPPTTSLHEIQPLPMILVGDNPQEEGFSGYYILTEAQGWGGPLDLATIVDEHGEIKNILVLSHRETLSFFYRLQKKDYFQQFIGKHVSDPLIPDRDIDTISQATVSSKAIAEAVRRGSHTLGREILGLEITEEKTGWNFGRDEILLLLLIGAALTGLIWIKLPLFRYAVMLASFIFLGFMQNASLSIAHIGALLLGYFPSIREYPFWWILLGSSVLLPLLLRRNLYCHSLCPFGNLQELNTKISGINLPVGKRINRGGRYISYALTWLALAVIFYKTNPALGAYEPFPTLFGLDGIEIQWFVLSSAIFGSFFLSRFFCRFFCPAGVVLNLLVKFRCAVDKLLKAKRPCPE